MWVDAAQDYAVQRVDEYDRNRNLAMRITVTQSRVSEPGVGWLPEHWTSVMYHAGNKLFRQVEVSTRTREINSTSSPADFQLALPSGTLLSEERGKDMQHSVLREDGSKRVVLPSERGASYEDLLRTNSGDLAPQTPGSRSWWLVAIGVVVVLGSLLLLFRRYSLRQSMGPNSEITSL